MASSEIDMFFLRLQYFLIYFPIICGEHTRPMENEQQQQQQQRDDSQLSDSERRDLSAVQSPDEVFVFWNSRWIPGTKMSLSDFSDRKNVSSPRSARSNSNKATSQLK
jgi:hypothetical protein